MMMTGEDYKTSLFDGRATYFEGERIELPGSEFPDEKKIQGSNMGSNRFRVDMPRYVDLYLSGRLKLDELVSARIGLDQINDGFDAMRRGEVARSVIEFA